MDESISFLSFSLDPVIADNDASGISSLEYVPGILEHTADTNTDQTFFVLHTPDQYNSVDPPQPVTCIGGFEISRANDLDQAISFANLDQPSVHINRRSDILDHLTENELIDDACDVPKSIARLDDADASHIFVNHNNNLDQHSYLSSDNEIRNSVIKLGGKLNDDAFDDLDSRVDNLEPSALEEANGCGSDNQGSLQETSSVVDKKTKKISQKITNDTENDFICEHCPDVYFGSKSKLNRHRWKLHKPPPKLYSCTECELTFSLASRLKSHMLSVHLHYRPYKCNQCTRNFSKLCDLKKHIDTHNATKSHSCGTCGKTFTDLSNLERHRSVHADEKPYRCSSCGKRYMQLSSLKKHRTGSQAALYGPCGGYDHAVRQYHCRQCGDSFKYKKWLAEHERTHSDDIENVNKISDLGRHVDALIQGILKEETMQEEIEEQPNEAQANEQDQQTQLEATKVFNVLNVALEPFSNDNIHTEPDRNELIKVERSYEIELINEIDRLEGLGDEADAAIAPNTEFQMQHDFFDASIDPPMNFNNFDNFNHLVNVPIVKEDIYDVNGGDVARDDLHFQNIGIEGLTDDLISLPRAIETEAVASLDGEHLAPTTVAVGDCATIFESDVDLESSANLAANLNQLIAENTVEFVSTEDDDTFIINLNSGIDTDQLSDLLNIGIEVVGPGSFTDELPPRVDDATAAPLKRGGRKTKVKKPKRPAFYKCKYCMKIFKKRDNYLSHLGLHDARLSRHKCEVCRRSFSYRSTLNKHLLAAHTPAVWPCHRCALCGKRYKHKWMLTHHRDHVHRKIYPYHCSVDGCGKVFYKRSDFAYHERLHMGVRPYKCTLCNLRFAHASHRARHRRKCAQNRRGGGQAAPDARTAAELSSIEMSTELLSDIDDLLKSKMNAAST